MKEEVRSVLAERLLGLVVEAATDEQGIRGRGVLCVKCTSGGVGWSYKLVAECVEEISEWAELEGLLSDYTPGAEVLIALFDEGAEFFRVPLAGSRRSTERAR